MNNKLLLYTVLTSFLIRSCIVTAGDFQYSSLDMWNQTQPIGSIAIQIQKPSFWRAPISFIGNHPYLTGTVIVLLGAKFMIELTAKEMTSDHIKKLKNDAEAAYNEAIEAYKLDGRPNYETLHDDYINKQTAYNQAVLEKTEIYKKNKTEIYKELLTTLIKSLKPNN